MPFKVAVSSIVASWHATEWSYSTHATKWSYSAKVLIFFMFLLIRMMNPSKMTVRPL